METEQPSQQLTLIDVPETELVECVQQVRYSGKIACKLEDRAAKIVRLVLLRASVREIQRECHVDYRTVAAIVRIMEENGKLPALKQRLSDDLGEIAELSAANLKQKLLDNEVPANVLPIVLGVAVDKKALVDGDPTARMEIEVTNDITPEAAREYLDRLKQVKTRMIEAQALPAPIGVISSPTPN